MKAREMREETADGLAERLKETQKALFQHRTRIASGEGINPHLSRAYRKDIARLKTLLRAVEMVSEGRRCTRDEAKRLLDENRWSIDRALLSRPSYPGTSPSTGTGVASQSRGLRGRGKLVEESLPKGGVEGRTSRSREDVPPASPGPEPVEGGAESAEERSG